MLTIRGFGRDCFVVRNDPPHFMLVTVTPQKAADFPDITVPAAVRAAAYRTTSIQREWQYVVGFARHFRLPEVLSDILYRRFDGCMTVTRLSRTALNHR